MHSKAENTDSKAIRALTKSIGIVCPGWRAAGIINTSSTHGACMGFISDILEYGVIVNHLPAGTLLSSVSRHEPREPLHNPRAHGSRPEVASWEGT